MNEGVNEDKGRETLGGGAAPRGGGAAETGAGYGNAQGYPDAGGGMDSSGGTGSTGGAANGDADQAVQRSETIDAEDVAAAADPDLIDNDDA